jgi:hypothetical protein
LAKLCTCGQCPTVYDSLSKAAAASAFCARVVLGWLQKKGSKGFGKKGGKGFVWRWFIYKPKEHQLLYYEKDGPKMELKGAIEMKYATRVYVLDNKYQDKARQSFAVELPKRTYLLQAGDRKQMSKWVDFLSACKTSARCTRRFTVYYCIATAVVCTMSVRLSHFLDDSVAVACARISLLGRCGLQEVGELVLWCG